MSHRRKSAKPTNKLRRTPADASSVSSDSDADHTNKMLLEDCVSRDSADPLTPSSSPQLALPPDLWQDFQALQAATHLDTAALIRRLIHQYGRTGSQDEHCQRSSPSADVDLRRTGEDVQPVCDVTFVGGETAYCGSHQACSSSETVLTRDFSTGTALTTDADDDFVVLDLSSGVRSNNLAPSGPGFDEVNILSDNADGDAEKPLDLTVSSARKPPQSSSRKESIKFLNSRVPEAHRPSSDKLLALPQYMLCTTTAAVDTTSPRAAHLAVSESVRVPCQVSSSLFNLSGLDLAGHGIHSAAQAEKSQAKVSGVSDNESSMGVHNGKQKIVQHFLSLPAGLVPGQETPQAAGDDHPKQVSLSTAAVSVLASTSPSGHRHISLVPDTSPVNGTMQLPTVTSLEFEEAVRGEHSQRVQDHVKTSQFVTPSVTSLPTSASAIFLDVGSGGLFSTSGGGLAGVSALNIPLMATGAGGLVAIPFLHALPESLAAAAAGGVPQGQQASHTLASSPPTSQIPLSHLLTQQIPPPPPYSVAVSSTSSSSSKAFKGKIGRPRGQPKAQKAIPKDMKLLTENTLFPGVYTSILKLPWSRRSRAKSSTKIKDFVANSVNAPGSASPSADLPMTAVRGEPGELLHDAQQHHSLTTANTSDGAPLGLLSMPILVPDVVPETPTLPPYSSVSASSSSVVMVYHNAIVSEVGKPIRRRGRPPKLPVLSQLLAGKTTPQGDGEPSEAVKEPVFSTFGLAIPPTSSSSQQAFSADFNQPVINSFPAKIKQEPMEVTFSKPSKLFPSAEIKSREDSSRGQGQELQLVHPVKQEARDMTSVTSGGEGGGTSAGDFTADAKDRFHEASLETRFNILANQLGLEIGSPYHTNLVYNQSLSASGQPDSSLYQQMMLSSRSMVEMKPRRRQLSSLIRPNDDCVYTSFRIRPRNSGRRGGKRRNRKKSTGSGPKYNVNNAHNFQIPVSESQEFQTKEMYYEDKDGSETGPVARGVGSAVITEKIPGAGEEPQRLYQDLYHCKLCNEMLPADSTLLHTCNSRLSPPLRSCHACGTMYLFNDASADGQAVLPNLCDECVGNRQHPQSPGRCPSVEIASQLSISDGFACQPCGVHFVNIADYIQHRRSAHLEKMNRYPRKTHTLKTLPCPTQGCPRLFHMRAELNRHIQLEHPGEAEQDVVMECQTASPSSGQQNLARDLDVDSILPSENDDVDCAEEEHPQFPCTQDDCPERFLTPIDLLEHVQSSHEGVTHWPCPLAGCTRQFGAERHLRVHLLMHKEEKPLKCPFCNYRCRQKNALNWHIRKHPESSSHYRKYAGVSADC